MVVVRLMVNAVRWCCVTGASQIYTRTGIGMDTRMDSGVGMDSRMVTCTGMGVYTCIIITWREIRPLVEACTWYICIFSWMHVSKNEHAEFTVTHNYKQIEYHLTLLIALSDCVM